MSINHLYPNTPIKLDIACNSCNCETMKVFDKLEVKDFFWDAKNGDKIELSSVLNKGNMGSVLKSNGDGTVQWGSDLTGGVNYTGSLPTVVNGLTVYNGVDGSTIGDTVLTTQDIIDLQNDKVAKAGDTMTGNLTLSGTNELQTRFIQDNGGGLYGIEAKSLFKTPFGLRTTSIRHTTPGSSVRLDDNIDCNNKQLRNCNSIQTSTLSTQAGLGGQITVVGGPINLNANSLTNVNNLQTQEIKATNGVSVNIQDDLDMGLFDINNCNDIRINALTTNTVPNIVSNNNIDMNTNDLLDVGNTDTTSLTINTTTKYISNVSQLPTASGGFHLLEDNTSYIICGQITLINGIQFGNNCSLSGVDFSASITFDETLNDIVGFKSVDTNVYLSKLTIIGGGGRFSGVPSFATGLFNCDDYDVVGGFPFYGRNRRFKVDGCNFIAVYSLGRVRGYATLNFNNNLISGTGAFNTYEGLEVIDGLSLEFLGNKIVLFRGGADPTNPAKLLRLGNSIVIPVIPQKPDGLMGFNAVNISSNILHPRGNFENGVDFGKNSKTELGVISGNTFIRSGGTAPLINYLLADTFDNYATTGVVNYDIEANAGVVNSSPLLKSIIGLGTQIIAPAVYTDLPFPISNIKALDACKRFGLEITLTGVSGVGYTKGNFLESTTGIAPFPRYCIADVDNLVGTTQTVVITDMSAPIPDVLGSRELDKDFIATGIINTGIQNTAGDITPIYRYFDKDPRQLILQTSLSYENDTKDETVEFRPIVDQGAGYIDTDDCSVITTALKAGQLQTITITCAILCKSGTKIKFQVKQIAPDVANITVGKMVNTMK